MPPELDEVNIRLNLQSILYVDLRVLAPLLRFSKYVRVATLDERRFEGSGAELEEFFE